MANFKDRTFEIHGHFIILKELGGNKVICKCLNCGYVDTHIKQRVVDEKTSCKGCIILNKTIGPAGKIYNDMLVLGKNKEGLLKCECLKCHTVGIYKQSDIKNKTIICTKCVAIKAEKDLTGNTLGDLTIIRDDGVESVKCHCKKCNRKGIYNKAEFIRGESVCKFCGTKKKTRKKINTTKRRPNVGAGVLEYMQIYKLEYEICGVKYYKCKCKNCEKEMVLSAKEIKNHKCQ